MTTSGTVDFTQTGQQLVDKALRKLGVIGENANANAAQYQGGQDALNMMLGTWQMNGPRLWGRADATLTLVSGTQTYTLSPRPMQVHTMRFAIDGVEMRPLAKWGLRDWDVFPPKTQTGLPTCYVLDRQATGTSVTLWPIPSFSGATWTCPYSYDRVFEQVTASSQTIDVPQEWYETVVMCLAARLTEEYPAGDNKDSQRHLKIIARAEGLYEEAMGFDRDGDVRFVRGDYG